MGTATSREARWIKIFVFCLPVLFFFSNLSFAISNSDSNHEEENAKITKKAYKEEELIIKFKKDASEAEKESFYDTYKIKKIKEFPLLNLHHVKLKKGMTVEQAVAIFGSDNNVEYAEPNFAVTVQVSPNDLLFSSLWGLYNTGQTGGTAGADIDAIRAWDVSTGSENVIVAVIDTGIDYTHPDIRENLWVNLSEYDGRPGFDDDGNGYADDLYGINACDGGADPLDDHGHGTHVAGIIGAAGNNTAGVTGVNWRVKIVPCKFLDSYGYGYIDGAVQCLLYVMNLRDRGVNVVATNNSWGGGGYSQALYEAVATHAQRGILFVAAAGNEVSDADTYDFYPANYDVPNVLSVAATDHNDGKAWFSNYGRRKVHVGAPGTDIISLRARGTDIYGDGRHFYPSGSSDPQYYRASGTSMAAPHVTGLAALINAQRPHGDWAGTRNLILSGSENVTLFGMTMAGRINAFYSLSCVDRPLMAPLNYPVAFEPGVTTVLSAISINCESPEGPVTVMSSAGEIVSLRDDGIEPDLVAGDGIFSSAWKPADAYSYLTFSSPTGTTTVPAPSISTGRLQTGFVNSPYSQKLEVSGGFGPYAWSLFSGALPAGLALNGVTGEISGTPTATGRTAFTVQVTDSLTSHALKTFSLTVEEIDLVIMSASGPDAASLGQKIPIAVSVRNQGNGESEDFYVSLYLSQDPALDANDASIATYRFDDLDGGETKTASVNATVPVTLAPGMYYLFAFADTGNRIGESNEGNNSLLGAQIIVISETDLVVTSVSGPTAASPGQQVSITAAVRNEGAAEAGGFYVSVYLSTDAVITADDIELRSGFVSQLTPGGLGTVTIDFNLPLSIPEGIYYLGAVADSRAMVAEAREENNWLAGSQIMIVKPDLVITSVSGPTTASSGQEVPITATVRNRGTGQAGGFYLSVYLSADPAITADDLEISEVYVGSVAPGSQQTVTVNAILPAALVGTYYIGVAADSYDYVIESNEINNSLVGNLMTVTGGARSPDLFVTFVSGPAGGVAGQQVSVTAAVKNAGSSGAGGFYVSAYLSADPVITATDIRLGSAYVSSLGSGSLQTVTINGALPWNLSGSYYIGAVADSHNYVVESDEINNSLAGNQIAVRGSGPDLVITSVDGPVTAQSGRMIEVTATVRNIGNTNAGSTRVFVYLSADSVISATDAMIGIGYVGSLSAGGMKTVTIYATAPQGITGSYFIGASADGYNWVSEANENNNFLTGNQIIVASP